MGCTEYKLLDSKFKVFVGIVSKEMLCTCIVQSTAILKF